LADGARPRVEPVAVAGGNETAWRHFTRATTAESFCRGWLDLQCRQIPGVTAAVVFGRESSAGSNAFSPLAVWGEALRNLVPLADAARHVLTGRRSVVVIRHRAHADEPSRARYLVACRAHLNGSTAGAVAVEVEARSASDLRAVVRQLQWGAGWLEVLAHRREGTARPAAALDRIRDVLDVLAGALGEERFIASATAVVTSIAAKHSCDRVSIGFVEGGRVRVRAVSHTAQFGTRTNLLRAIAAAMDEAIDQRCPVLYPALPGGTVTVTRAHEEIGCQQGSAILTVPFAQGPRLLGALTLERSIARPFDGGAVEFAQAIAALAGPLLELRRLDDRWLAAKAIDAGRRQVARLLGPRHIGRKLGVIAGAAALAFLVLATGEYRVAARAVVEADVRRVAVAPFSGYIREAPARAGDLVRGGQLLAALDDRELRLERAKWSGQHEQLLRQQHHALAIRNAAQIAITAAQIDQARAQLALLDEQLAKSRIVASLDGVVVVGDLSQSLGAPVEKGQVLFQVAPLDVYRIVLEVDERDVSDVAAGQRGQLLLAAVPNTLLAFTVDKITPVSTAHEARNYFRVEAALDRTPDRLRPGMEGVGKISVDSRRLVSIWARSLIDWARLALWAWTA
jgi:multidrug resistance efflux pump